MMSSSRCLWPLPGVYPFDHVHSAVLLKFGSPNSNDSARVWKQVLHWISSAHEIKVRDQEAKDDGYLREEKLTW